MSPVLHISDGDDHRLLRLDRPEKGNALSEALVAELDAALTAAEAEDVPLLVLTGAGRHFCTGFDLDDLESLSDGDLLARFVRIEMLLDRLFRLSVPTLAVAQGRAMGAGADLVVACRRRLLTEGASLAFPGVNFGLVLGTRRLGLRVGAGAAEEILTSGRRVEADEARALGLAQEVLPEEERAARIEREAARAARLPGPVARSLRDALDADEAGSDGDLARLVRSAVPAGLKERIAAYRAGLRKPAPQATPA
ncbi:enoyl-CoA hydratase/isomerase family protein [Aquicoccus sp. SCR17]|nr:enoyl-CoA hydratase/isomerase family protein [Carideicomes alvinocaridis]